MPNYIIKYKTKVDGIDDVVLYHESIIINTIKDTISTYVESLTTDIKLARGFFEKEEAMKVAGLFENNLYAHTIIKKI